MKGKKQNLRRIHPCNPIQYIIHPHMVDAIKLRGDEKMISDNDFKFSRRFADAKA